jgi:hypothetical protein
MKTFIKSLLSGVLFTLFCSISFSALADDPNPPVVPGEHGAAGDVPVGAPIDNGVIILLAMGVGYATFKLFSSRKIKAEKLEN